MHCIPSFFNIKIESFNALNPSMNYPAAGYREYPV